MDTEEETEEVQLRMKKNAKYDAELIHQTIQELSENKKKAQRNKASGDFFVEEEDDDDEQVLISRLLDEQIESPSLKEDVTMEPPKPASETDVLLSAVNEEEEEAKEDENVGGAEMGEEAATILRELGKVKRQNSITHWLLSTMIFLTLAWQLSEISIIMNVKNNFSHPFRAVETAFKGILGGRQGKKNHETYETSDDDESTKSGPLLNE